MTRLYVESLAPGRLRLAGVDFRYLARVLRLGPGAELVLFDGLGREARARIVSVGGHEVEVEVEEPRVQEAPRRLHLTLMVALLKSEKMDLVVQKATELGVDRLVPVAAARSVVRLDPARAAARVSRWGKIAREAARQCGRADAPEVAAPLPLGEAVAQAPADAWKALLHEGTRAASLRSALPDRPPQAVVAAVGPEGGFEAAEVDAAREAGFAVVGLGPRILRAETAALAALVVLGYALGDLG
jgi:16S rRNA (uracil1498-N3)-methyltransferase